MAAQVINCIPIVKEDSLTVALFLCKGRLKIAGKESK